MAALFGEEQGELGEFDYKRFQMYVDELKLIQGRCMRALVDFEDVLFWRCGYAL